MYIMEKEHLKESCLPYAIQKVSRGKYVARSKTYPSKSHPQ